MGEPVTTSGTRVFISTIAVTNATDTLAEFAALTWTEIGLIETIGDFGDEASTVNFSAIGDGRVRKSKGARDAGTMALTCAFDAADVGQNALDAAEQTNSNYAFRVVFNDGPTASYSDTIVYFRGLVLSKRLSPGGNDTILKRTFNVAVNSQLYFNLSTSV